MKPGIYSNVDFDKYRGVKAVHKSMFKHIMKSGKHLKHYLDKGDEEKVYMVFGNLVDTLLFEPEKFIDRFTCPPETYTDSKGIEKPWTWRANTCKEWRENIEDGVSIVTGEDIDKAKKMVEEIKLHPEAQKWLYKAEYQVSMFWVDPDTDLLCCGRPDVIQWQNDEIIRIPDLKVTNNNRPGGFSRTVYNFLYHAGAAFYHDGSFLARGLPVPKGGQNFPTGFITIEDTEPYDVICYNLDEESFEIGRVIYKECLQKYRDFIDNNEYPGYSNIAEDIAIPQYAINKYQFEGVLE